MHLLRPIAALLIACVWLAPSAQAERRVALVIGNSDYAHAEKLGSPQADAEAMASLLDSLGFKVVRGIDLGLDNMMDHINRFAQEAGGADVGLFYYAGHALQIEGENLLIPVDASIRNEVETRRRTIAIGSILDAMETKVKLVLLDACRNNPFASRMSSKSRFLIAQSGLAEMKSAKGTFIAFATSPGKTALDGEEGKNSPFTRALLTHLPTPGVEIGVTFKRVRAQVVDETRERQLPWDHNSMTGEFFMRPGDAGAAPQATQAGESKSAGGFDDRARELELWSSIETSTNPNYRAYLDRYPHGTYATIARIRIAQLARTVDTETIVRALTREEDEEGEEQAPTIDLYVRFEFDQAALTMSDARIVVDTLGKALKDPRLANMSFEIIGHTDARGGDKYNMKLSRDRAEAVRSRLIQLHGVDAGRLKAEGRGKHELKDPSRPEHEINRRVQIRMVNDKRL